MKLMVSLVLTLCFTTHGCASEGQEGRLEDGQSSYQQAPAGPPIYGNEPGEVVFANELEIRKSHSKTLFLQLMRKIYTDKSIKKEIRKKYPALTADQLLLHTRQEKNSKMDREGLTFLQKKLPEISRDELEKNTQNYKKEFFAQEAKLSDCACCLKCCFKNYVDIYKWNHATGKREYTVEENKWKFDEPACCACCR